MTRIAGVFPSLASTDKRVQRTLERILRHVIDNIQPKDPNIRAWAYLALGFSLKRLERIDEALEVTRSALQIDPTSARGWFNAACYAALQGTEDESLAYLKEALIRDPYLQVNAIDESDLKSIRHSQKFKILTGQV